MSFKHVRTILANRENPVGAWGCSYCGNHQTRLSLQLIPTGKEAFNFPDYIPQIKKSCLRCHRHRRWVKQTPQLIDRWNERLEIVYLSTEPIEQGGLFQ